MRDSITVGFSLGWHTRNELKQSEIVISKQKEKNGILYFPIENAEHTYVAHFNISTHSVRYWRQQRQQRFYHHHINAHFGSSNSITYNRRQIFGMQMRPSFLILINSKYSPHLNCMQRQRASESETASEMNGDFW